MDATPLCLCPCRDPELLVLDEPTNHLDFATIDWLARRLCAPGLTVVFVTHDRAFMEAVCTTVLEIDAGSVFAHQVGGPGSYAAVRELRESRRAAQLGVATDAQARLRKESAWMARQPKARSTKSKARIEQYYELTKLARSAPQVGWRMACLSNGCTVRRGALAAVHQPRRS